jgi:hypothetical protein
VLKGGSQCNEKLGTEEGKQTAVETIKGLVTFLQQLNKPDFAQELVDSVVATTRKHQALMMGLAVNMYDEVPAAQAAAVHAAHGAAISTAATELLGVFREAATQLKNSAALDMLEEALAVQTVRSRYDACLRPANLPCNNADMYRYLGVPPRDREPFAANRLKTQWKGYQDGWAEPAPAAAARTQGDVYLHWSKFAARDSGADLGQLAMHHWGNPLSAAACERVYSRLSNSDTDNRQAMPWEVLHDVLFLRANWRVVEKLVGAQHRAIIDSECKAAGSSGQLGGVAGPQAAAQFELHQLASGGGAAVPAAGGAGGTAAGTGRVELT